MHFCFLIFLSFLLIIASDAKNFDGTVTVETDVPFTPTSDAPDFTTLTPDSSSDFPGSSTTPDWPTDSTSSFSPSDSTSSNFPTDSTASVSPDFSTTSSHPSSPSSPSDSTAATLPLPSSHRIKHPKKKNPILRSRNSVAKKLRSQKLEKTPTFEDSDSVECKTSPLTIDFRQQILDSHNEFRSTLANGMSELPDGKFASPASNMYKIKYSCKLEKIAQEWANQEIFQHKKNPEIPVGENLFLKWSTNDGLEDDAINETSISWWNELSQNDGNMISETNVTFVKGMNSIGHWSQMAWSSTEFIGCGFKKFKNESEPNRFYYYTVCNYFPAGNILGMQIYEIGNPCKKDSECTEKPKSICDVDTGLCYAN